MKLIKYVEWLIAQQGPHQTGPKQVSLNVRWALPLKIKG